VREVYAWAWGDHCWLLVFVNVEGISRDGARKFYGRGPAKILFWFFRIFLLKKFYFSCFLN
jgi:hypothetical protein